MVLQRQKKLKEKGRSIEWNDKAAEYTNPWSGGEWAGKTRGMPRGQKCDSLLLQVLKPKSTISKVLAKEVGLVVKWA